MSKRMVFAAHRKSACSPVIRGTGQWSARCAISGFGRNTIEALETNANGRITPAVLHDAMARGEGHLLLVLNAADLDVRACDPLLFGPWSGRRSAS